MAGKSFHALRGTFAKSYVPCIYDYIQCSNRKASVACFLSCSGDERKQALEKK